MRTRNGLRLSGRTGERGMKLARAAGRDGGRRAKPDGSSQLKRHDGVPEKQRAKKTASDCGGRICVCWPAGGRGKSAGGQEAVCMYVSAAAALQAFGRPLSARIGNLRPAARLARKDEQLVGPAAGPESGRHQGKRNERAARPAPHCRGWSPPSCLGCCEAGGRKGYGPMTRSRPAGGTHRPAVANNRGIRCLPSCGFPRLFPRVCRRLALSGSQ